MNTKLNILRPLTDREARRLLALFEEGATSVAEEKALYAYFHRHNLPQDMEQLRGLMAWYEEGCQGEPPAVELAEPTRRPNWFRRGIIAAASVVVLLGIGFGGYRYHASTQSPYEVFAEIYDGSYVIKDGEKITDPKLIHDDVIAASLLSDSISDLIAMHTDQNRIIYEVVKRQLGDDNPEAIEMVMNTILTD